MEKVVALIEAAWPRPERHRVFLYMPIALPTCGRGEAILELDGHQIDAGLYRRVVDTRGRPAMLPPRRKLGESESRPRLRGLGTPHTLRHTDHDRNASARRARGPDRRRRGLRRRMGPTNPIAGTFGPDICLN
jgi:hypothetical protein